jgi:lipoprotein NlpD
VKQLARYVLLLVGIVALAGCAGALTWTPPGGAQSGMSSASDEVPAHYTVQPGDTLYSIAWRYGLDYHDVAGWNGVGSDYLIKPGQVLKLSAPAGGSSHTHVQQAGTGATLPARQSAQAANDSGFKPPEGGIVWMWPVSGRVIRQFHDGSALSKGIDITATRGTDIRAAAAGKVVYAGSGIIGYGKLIIIKDSEQFLSAYADNDEMLVREGDVVQAGDRIATMGLGRDGNPLLHFEIRRNGKPVDPLQYLPRR